ncbi:TPA: hydrolase, partial [Streptococcus pneumoniae]|nr:hydrolase [Streptococcus pneumoniae]HEW3116650.1 hydrolase [Streptococcus pneumoniae]
MKFLTLNTHSWMEKEAEEKFQILLEDILEKDYDLICFQEINQEMTSSEVEVNDLYQALP